MKLLFRWNVKHQINNSGSAVVPILFEPRRFLDIADAHFLRDAVSTTCAALGVANDDTTSRAIVSGRVAELARSGMTSVDAIRDRVVYEARAVAEISA
jgi:hypothetical protein